MAQFFGRKSTVGELSASFRRCYIDGRVMKRRCDLYDAEGIAVIPLKTLQALVTPPFSDRPNLPVFVRGLTAMRVMHRLPVKFRAVFGRTLAALGQMPVIALAIVKTMIDVSVKMFRPVIPRSRP